jgi:hypothetical protein
VDGLAAAMVVVAKETETTVTVDYLTVPVAGPIAIARLKR